MGRPLIAASLLLMVACADYWLLLSGRAMAAAAASDVTSLAMILPTPGGFMRRVADAISPMPRAA